MSEPRVRDARRTRAQVVGAIVAIAALLWALLIRRDAPMTTFQMVAGWLMVAGLAAYLFVIWRRR